MVDWRPFFGYRHALWVIDCYSLGKYFSELELINGVNVGAGALKILGQASG